VAGRLWEATQQNLDRFFQNKISQWVGLFSITHLHNASYCSVECMVVSAIPLRCFQKTHLLDTLFGFGHRATYKLFFSAMSGCQSDMKGDEELWASDDEELYADDDDEAGGYVQVFMLTFSISSSAGRWWHVLWEGGWCAASTVCCAYVW
jgi:hypothetical protein